MSLAAEWWIRRDEINQPIRGQDCGELTNQRQRELGWNMATSPREATKAVSEQIMKMYGWLANLLVIVNVFANKSPRCRPPARSIQTWKRPVILHIQDVSNWNSGTLNTLIMPQNTASTHTTHTSNAAHYTFVTVSPCCEQFRKIYAKFHDAEGRSCSFCFRAPSAEGHDQETATGAQGRIQGMVNGH